MKMAVGRHALGLCSLCRHLAMNRVNVNITRTLSTLRHKQRTVAQQLHCRGNGLTKLRYLSSKTTSSTHSDYNNTGSPVTAHDMVARWIQVFTDKSIPEPESSAQLIVAHVMGKKMIHEVDVSTLLPKDAEHQINKLCTQRLDRTPVPYIIGEWDFHEMTLAMKPPVLVPRPETEELAALICDDWRAAGNTAGTVLDIGCGSGAISLYLLKQLPQVRCVAVDVNDVACDLTLHNARLHDVQDRLTVIHADLCTDEGMSKLSELGPYNVIVSNPPYITTQEMQQLQQEIYRFEDHRALDGGEDGLRIVKHILTVASSLLKPSGYLWFEVGLKHPSLVQDLVKAHPEYSMDYLQTICDFTKRERFCKLSSTGRPLL